VKYEYFPPAGSGNVVEWENQGWDKADAIGYLEAYYQNLVLPVQQLDLRIPGAAEYWHELDVRLSSVLSGATEPKEPLNDMYQAWEQITDRYGRESQKRLYAESYGPTVLLAAKTYGSVFYDKLTCSIARTKW
jgi:multiple sugar transport system substrate-binding protein